MPRMNKYIISTKNRYEAKIYRFILNMVLKDSRRFGESIYVRNFEDDSRMYWKFLAYVTKDEEIRIRELVEHSKFPNFHLSEVR